MTDYSEGFQQFWDAWPANGQPPFKNYTRKKGKPQAFKNWQKNKLEDKTAAIVAFVEKSKKYNKAWLKDQGGWIPLPATFLNSEDWEEGIADVRDDRKDKVPKPNVQHFDAGPDLSKYARFANLALLKKLLVIGGTGSEPGRPSEAITRAVKAKNEIVSLAEAEQWDNEEFKSVIFATIDQAVQEKEEVRQAV